MIKSSDTIAAISSAQGPGAVAIVRVSGPEAFSILERCFKPDDNAAKAAGKGTFVRHGTWANPENDQAIDRVRVIGSKGTNTYTGEPLFEVHCHGGSYVPAAILNSIVSQNGRMAEPGEFTQRAFLNGKIDLIQAEAVANLIAAQTEAAAKAALRNLEGDLSRFACEVRDLVKRMSAIVEMAIDFADDDPDPPEWSLDLHRYFEEAFGMIRRLLATEKLGIALMKGANAVIAGCPNVGKSTLLNALIGEERAIVTDIPGTTRDLVHGEISVAGYSLRIADTAGWTETEDPVEIEGVRRSKKALESSDIGLIVFDQSRRRTKEDDNLLAGIRPGIDAIILNKSDLPDEFGPFEPDADAPVFRVSAKSGEGVVALVDWLHDTVSQTISVMRRDDCPSVVTTLRQSNALHAAQKGLANAILHIDEGLGPEIVADDLRETLDALSSLVGKTTTEDILGTIFKTFCIGK